MTDVIQGKEKTTYPAVGRF